MRSKSVVKSIVRPANHCENLSYSRVFSSPSVTIYQFFTDMHYAAKRSFSSCNLCCLPRSCSQYYYEHLYYTGDHWADSGQARGGGSTGRGRARTRRRRRQFSHMVVSTKPKKKPPASTHDNDVSDLDSPPIRKESGKIDTFRV